MVAFITSSFLLAFTPSIKTLESNMVSRSLVLNKILQKHNGNRSKNMKKDTQIQNIKRYLEAQGQRVCKHKRAEMAKRG